MSSRSAALSLVVTAALALAGCQPLTAATLVVELSVSRQCDGGCRGDPRSGDICGDVLGAGVGSGKRPAWIVTTADAGTFGAVVEIRQASVVSGPDGGLATSVRSRSWPVPAGSSAPIPALFQPATTLYAVDAQGQRLDRASTSVTVVQRDERTFGFTYGDAQQTVTEVHTFGDVVRRPLEHIPPDDFLSACCSVAPAPTALGLALLVWWRRRGARR